MEELYCTLNAKETLVGTINYGNRGPAGPKGDKGDKGDPGTPGSQVSVSASGTSTNEVSYITIDGVESKLAGSGGTPANMVTTNTDQEIHASKTFISPPNNRYTEIVGDRIRCCNDVGTNNLGLTHCGIFKQSFASTYNIDVPNKAGVMALTSDFFGTYEGNNWTSISLNGISKAIPNTGVNTRHYITFTGEVSDGQGGYYSKDFKLQFLSSKQTAFSLTEFTEDLFGNLSDTATVKYPVTNFYSHRPSPGSEGQWVPAAATANAYWVYLREMEADVVRYNISVERITDFVDTVTLF